MTETTAAATPNDHEARILALLPTMTYEEVHRSTGFSRGKIYAAALKFGARKTEARIREKAVDRRRRQRETLEAIIDTTATSDVLDYLDSLPDGSVDLLVTSVPYNVGKTYGSTAGDSLRFTYWMGWMMQVVSEASRVLRDGGVLAFQAGSTYDHLDQIVPIDMLMLDTVQKSGLSLQNRIVWQVPHGLTPKRRLAGRHETVIVASKGVPAHFNAASARTPQKQPGKRAFKGPNKGSISSHPLGAWPTDVWQIANVGHNSPEKVPGHPCQMPEELARRLVQLYTMPGDLVVDPFSGSGTTHAVCIQTGRRFSGCDLMYADLREVRLAKAGLADFCPLPGVTDESIAVWQAEAVRVDHDPAQLDLLKVA